MIDLAALGNLQACLDLADALPPGRCREFLLRRAEAYLVLAEECL